MSQIWIKWHVHQHNNQHCNCHRSQLYKLPFQIRLTVFSDILLHNWVQWYCSDDEINNIHIFITGFNLNDHTEWGRPNMVILTPAHSLDRPISLSQSRHHICINRGVSASGSMGLPRRKPVHVQFSSGCHIWQTCVMWHHYWRQC